ncbi:hypothetical protein F5887DRAFT_919053 [Amanita rubescens]|nr:hypothetical protein F5887DRAFT_919053 [Amanita rubescens]
MSMTRMRGRPFRSPAASSKESLNQLENKEPGWGSSKGFGIQLATVLLNHSWKGNGTEPTYPYDDPDIKAKLGIKREHGTIDLMLTALVEINDEETVALADIQCAIKQLDKFNKQMTFLPNAYAAAAIHQCTIQSLLIKLGMEKCINISKEHQAADSRKLLNSRETVNEFMFDLDSTDLKAFQQFYSIFGECLVDGVHLGEVGTCSAQQIRG